MPSNQITSLGQRSLQGWIRKRHRGEADREGDAGDGGVGGLSWDAGPSLCAQRHPSPAPRPACWGEGAGEGRCEGGCCRPDSHKPSALSSQACPHPPPRPSRAFQPRLGPDFSLGQPLTMPVSGNPSFLLGALSSGSAHCQPFQVSQGGSRAGRGHSKDRHCHPGYGLVVQGTRLRPSQKPDPFFKVPLVVCLFVCFK